MKKWIIEIVTNKHLIVVNLAGALILAYTLCYFVVYFEINYLFGRWCLWFDEAYKFHTKNTTAFFLHVNHQWKHFS